MSTRRNVTLIDDLPYLQDLENSNISSTPPDGGPQVTKFIRPTSNVLPTESGMNPEFSYMKKNETAVKQIHKPSFPSTSQITNDFNSHIRNFVTFETNCVSCAEHTANCIVCSKLYYTDNTIYLIVIVVLLLISVLLFKKLLDVKAL
jgi:hypothetical protein